jgi:regulator of ribonuclease activity A
MALLPMPPDKRHPGVVDQPVQIQGVWVHPGEWLVADEDGIVVMPAAPR